MKFNFLTHKINFFPCHQQRKQKSCLSGLGFLFISKFTKLTSTNLLLKGSDTIIIGCNGDCVINTNSSSFLSTAGTGDVLSGILVSLLSQGYSRLETSILGTYLHAEAANYYMNNISKDGMTASDLIDCIPYAFNKLREDSVN